MCIDKSDGDGCRERLINEGTECSRPGRMKNIFEWIVPVGCVAHCARFPTIALNAANYTLAVYY